MLRIIVKDKDGFEKELDLYTDTHLSISGTSPFFDREMEEGEVSFPIDIPITAENSKILSNPESISEHIETTEWDIDAYYHNYMLSDYKLRLLSIRNFDLNKGTGTYVMAITGYLGSFAKDVGGLKIRDVIKEVINFTDADSRTFATNVMKNVYPNYTNVLGFAPVYCPEWYDESRSDYNDEETRDGIINRVHVDNVSAVWEFGNSTALDPNTAVVSGQLPYLHHQTVPFFYLKYITEKLFESLGYTLTGDFFNIEDIEKVAIFSNHSIEQYRYGLKTDVNKRILVANHIPDITVYEFMKALTSFFGISFHPKSDNLIDTRFINPDKPLPFNYSLNNIINNEIEIEFFDELEEGYAFEFGTPREDKKFNDAIAELPAEVSTVQTYAELSTTTPAEGDVFYVEADNTYFQFIGSDFIYYAEGLHTLTEGKAGNVYDTSIAPMAKAIYNTDAGITYNLNMTAFEGLGSYYNYSRVKVNNPCSFRLFYINKLTIGNAPDRPVATSHGVVNGTVVASVPMATKGDSNLFDKYHKRFFDFLQQSKKIKVVIPGDVPGLDIDRLFLTNIELFANQFIVVDYELSGNNGVELSLTLAQV